MQCHGVVPELAQATVAVEAKQCPNRPGLVVMVDMHGRRHLADGANAVLVLEEGVCLFRGDAITTTQVVCPLTADQFLGSATSCVVTGLAVRCPTGLRCGVPPERAERQNLAAVRAPLVSVRDGNPPRMPLCGAAGSAVAARLVAPSRMVAAIERIAVARIAVLGELSERSLLAAIAAKL